MSGNEVYENSLGQDEKIVQRDRLFELATRIGNKAVIQSLLLEQPDRFDEIERIRSVVEKARLLGIREGIAELMIQLEPSRKNENQLTLFD